MAGINPHKAVGGAITIGLYASSEMMAVEADGNPQSLIRLTLLEGARMACESIVEACNGSASAIELFIGLMSERSFMAELAATGMAPEDIVEIIGKSREEDK